MPNISGKAYALTTLCPIKNGQQGGVANSNLVRRILQELPENQNSPLAKVANTYLARFFVLDDAIFESYPNKLDTLKSKYLVFTSNLHGDIDTYLTGMWQTIEPDIKTIWGNCVGFDEVKSAEAFVKYIKKCQIETTFFFNGSTDDSLAEQLKSLYLKQEFSKFVFSHQGVPPGQLLADFKAFVNEVKPADLEFPTWNAGVCSLDGICKNQSINHAVEK